MNKENILLEDAKHEITELLAELSKSGEREFYLYLLAHLSDTDAKHPSYHVDRSILAVYLEVRSKNIEADFKSILRITLDNVHASFKQGFKMLDVIGSSDPLTELKQFLDAN